jgi:hypothetical protein
MPAALAALAAAGPEPVRPTSAASEAWAVKARIAESCSCSPPCSRLFGALPAGVWCEGSRLVQIEKGHFGGVPLDGLSVIVTFRVGEWAKYYVSYPATDAQLLAAEKLMSGVFPAFAGYGVRGAERTPLTVTRTPTRLKFASPFCSVEMERMEGREGKPIEIRNLPAEFLRSYTQYVSVENSHHDATHGFEYRGTSAFTSRLDARR